MDLMVSVVDGDAPIFDAGYLGCAGGLAAEFRRRIAEVESRVGSPRTNW